LDFYQIKHTKQNVTKFASQALKRENNKIENTWRQDTQILSLEVFTKTHRSEREISTLKANKRLEYSKIDKKT